MLKYTSIRTLLAIATQFDLELQQLDQKTTFLCGSLDETIYMNQLKGFEVKKKENILYLLNKSLYGLKIGPKAMV